jgi:hypothetical protein
MDFEYKQLIEMGEETFLKYNTMIDNNILDDDKTQ